MARKKGDGVATPPASDATDPPPADEAPARLRARVQLRRWVREHIDGGAIAGRRMPDVSRDALAWLQQNDPPLALDLLNEAFYGVVYSVVQETVAATRRTDFFVAGDRVVTRAEIGKRAVVFRSRWQTWVEYHKDHGAKLLMEMNRRELVEAAAVRRRRADSELELAWLYETMAARMRPNQKVRNVFTPEEIDALRAEAAAPKGLTA